MGLSLLRFAEKMPAFSYEGTLVGLRKEKKKTKTNPGCHALSTREQLTFVRVHLVACADGCERARGRMTAFDGRAIYLWISPTASLITAVAPH